MKASIWIGLSAAVLALLAAPKVLPLLHDAPRAAAAAKEAHPGRAKKNKDEAQPLPVSTYVVHTEPFSEVIHSTGSLRAEESVELQAETNGRVVAINFTEGAHVHQGDLLVKLNDSDLRATRERAIQRKALAVLKEKRFAELLKMGVANQEQYDTALSDVNVQSAEISLTDAQIAKTEIRAPFDGVVGLRYVSLGAFVNAATRVATLQRLDKLKVDFSVPEKYAGRIRVGSPVTFSVAGGTSNFTGNIYAYDPRIDTATRTVVIRAVCPNADERLLPGAFADVQLTLSRLDNAILVPAVAVIPGLTEKNVFVMKDGKAERRAVETGTRTETTVHILSGLKPGDIVITSGLQQMRAGLAVVGTDSDPDTAPARVTAVTPQT